MSQDNNYLLYGSLWKNIFIYSLPLILSNILQVFFNMADIMVIGQFSGPISLGGVGSTTNLITLFTAFLIGLSNGINVIVAKYVGSNDEDATSKAVHSGFIACLALGMLIGLLGVCFSREILILTNTKEVFLEKSTAYLKCYFLGMPFLALYNYGNGFFSAIGEKSLFFLLIAGIINVIFNIIFVTKFDLDVIGVGLASSLSFFVT